MLCTFVFVRNFLQTKVNYVAEFEPKNLNAFDTVYSVLQLLEKCAELTHFDGVPLVLHLAVNKLRTGKMQNIFLL